MFNLFSWFEPKSKPNYGPVNRTTLVVTLRDGTKREILFESMVRTGLNSSKYMSTSFDDAWFFVQEWMMNKAVLHLGENLLWTDVKRVDYRREPDAEVA